MVYKDVHEGIFRARPNRFVAEVQVHGVIERCHIKNTGRCKEILIPGARVYVNRSNNPNRVTKYDLFAVFKGGTLINIDSQAPNRVFYEYLKSGKYISRITKIKPEAKYGNSRFDFYVETEDNRKIFIEVKGVTLEQEGVARFPDAPTERGIKHLNELAESIKQGYEAHGVFIIQMKGTSHFEPNYATHAEFGETLVRVQSQGVKITALDCIVTANSLIIESPIPIKLLH
ncbi:MAG: DNA/RNA nuclease SfsA [Defluviitaleaceae bacterium]|nr:DNA/RNA nuclease SfsA [Defluviitaleaceae bacterium]